jgi:hypothetical protein
MEEEARMNRSTINVCRVLALAAVAVALVIATCATNAVAQDDVYAMGYFSNANATGAPDAQLRLSNDGNTGTNLWADIYVFNNDEEMEECCSCEVTPDGYLDLDVNKDLVGNPLTLPKPGRGILKVISSSTAGPTAPTPTIGIRGWLTQIQQGQTKSVFSITESDLKDSVLSSGEEGTLATTCSYVLSLGSGLGACSCNDAGD